MNILGYMQKVGRALTVPIAITQTTEELRAQYMPVIESANNNIESITLDSIETTTLTCIKNMDHMDRITLASVKEMDCIDRITLASVQTVNNSDRITLASVEEIDSIEVIDNCISGLSVTSKGQNLIHEVQQKGAHTQGVFKLADDLDEIVNCQKTEDILKRIRA